MKRILIVGNGGAGKSTLSTKLNEILDIPVVRLDVHRWKSGTEKISNEEFEKVIDPLLKKPTWIMDGNYRKHLPIRLAAADTIIFLDLPSFVCAKRVITRRINDAFHPEITHADGRFDLPLYPNFLRFLSWVWNFDKVTRPKMLELLKEHEKGKQVIILHSQTEVNIFVESLRS